MPQEVNHGVLHLVQVQIEYALATAFQGYLLEAHTNEHKLLNNVMK